MLSQSFTLAAFGSGETVPLNNFDLPAGGSVTITFQVDVDSPLGTCAGAVSNQGTVSGDNFASLVTDDPDTGAADDATVTALDLVDLGITKSNGTASSTPGGMTTYTILVTNAGPNDAVAASVADSFPAILSGVTWTCSASAGSSCTAAGSGDIADSVTILAGGMLTYTATGTIDGDASGNLINTATVTAPADSLECNTANNSATDTDTLDPETDLAVTKSNGTASSVPGTMTTYTITVTNNGPSDAVGASVTDTFPASLSGVTWTCSASAGSSCTAAGSGDIADSVNLLVGGTLTYSATGTIDAAATGSLANTVTAAPAAGATDPVPANDSATDTDTLTPETDLAVTKTDDVDPPMPGQNVVYTIRVDNLGPSDSTGSTVTDNLPAGITLVATTGCAEDPNGVPTCTLGAIAAGSFTTYTIEVSVDPSPPASVDNEACVSGDETDPNAANDCDTETTTFDATAPTVDVVAFQPPSGDGEVDECETIQTELLQLELTFSEPMNIVSPMDAASATNPANYRLVAPVLGSDFDTVDCMGGTGADEVISIDGVSYDGGTDTATLTLNGGDELINQQYRLVACGTLEDEAGNALDGGGGAGMSFLRTFRVDVGNLFADGHFDDFDPVACTLDAWDSTNIAQVELSSEDVDASPISGSAHNASPTAGFDLTQCVALTGGQKYRFDLSLQVGAAVGEAVAVQLACEFFDQVACGGSSLGTAGAAQAVFSTGMAWQPQESTLMAPAGTLSARCGIELSPGNAMTFDANFDNLFLGLSNEIFTDGFESGDTSRWTETFP
ncbi:MAG: hypothetical protein SX243_06085 [Acidobacteriota bacterium]|nr:hypothetical protein [Acidobacteriota bacterium]